MSTQLNTHEQALIAAAAEGKVCKLAPDAVIRADRS